MNRFKKLRRRKFRILLYSSYDLEAIITVGYRVDSDRGSQFRIWDWPPGAQPLPARCWNQTLKLQKTISPRKSSKRWTILWICISIMPSCRPAEDAWWKCVTGKRSCDDLRIVEYDNRLLKDLARDLVKAIFTWCGCYILLTQNSRHCLANWDGCITPSCWAYSQSNGNGTTAKLFYTWAAVTGSSLFKARVFLYSFTNNGNRITISPWRLSLTRQGE